MAADGLRLHPRTLTVRRAGTKLGGLLWDVQDELAFDYPAMIVAVATFQANLARIHQDEAPAPGTAPGYGEVTFAVVTVEQEFELTAAETMGLLAEHQQLIAKHMIRAERHPDHPQADADEE